jgi:4-amino-4-deoxy-L-arabinose transferase-like glycosyltransferase
MKALVLFALALLIRLAIPSIWQFDGLYGQDAFAYYRQAVAIAQGVPAGALPPLDFFWPNGYPALAAMAIWLLGSAERSALLASVLCGAALAPLVYGLSRDLFPGIGARAGLWAGLMVAVAGQPVLSSVVIMADVPALFWAALAAWLLVRTWPVRVEPGEHRRGYLLLAGIGLGLAVVTRWIYALLALPFAAYALYQTRRFGTSWPSLVLPALGGLAVLAPQVWLSLNRPESLLHSWLLNWRFVHAFGRQFEHIDGHYSYTLPVGIFYLLPLAHPSYMIPLFGVVALWGMWRLWQEQVWGALILLGGWLGVVYLFLAGIPYQNFRFGLTLYLPAVVLAGVGVEMLRVKPPRLVSFWKSTSVGRRFWDRGVHVAMIVCLLGMVSWTMYSTGRFISVQNQSKVLAQQVENAVPAGATVLAFGLTLTLQHYTDLNVVEFYSLDEGTLETVTVASPPVYLLLDLKNLETQWQDRPPARNYQWLQSHKGLTPVADLPPYLLFHLSERTSQ